MPTIGITLLQGEEVAGGATQSLAAPSFRPDYMIDILHVLAGFGVGVMLGLTGIGGGAMMTPILLLIFGTAPKTAVGTDLMFAAITKLVGVGMHGARGNIDWQVVYRLSAGSLPAAAATSGFLALFGRDATRLDAFLLHAIGATLILTATGLLLKPWLHALGRHFRIGSPQAFKRIQGPLTVMVGVALGVIVALTSIGAGALGATFLVYLYPLRLTPARLVGTDLAHAIPLASVAGLGYLIMGHVDYRLLGGLLLGSIPGIALGAWWSSRASGAVLGVLIAAMLALSGARILWR